MRLILDTPYPNRAQLALDSPFVGPLSASSTAFDPSTDVEYYQDGVANPTIDHWAWDQQNNRYLVWFTKPVSDAATFQAVYHMPSTPYEDTNAKVLPGFALLATIGSGDSTLTAYAGIAASPSAPASGAAFTLLWQLQNVYQVELVSSATGTYITPSQYVTTPSGYGSFLVSAGVTSSTTYTLNCYDQSGNPIVVSGADLAPTVTVTPT